jgi:very-short-patch-repair endonuclease
VFSLAILFALIEERLLKLMVNYHLTNKEFDQARTEFLKTEGFTVIRFTNDELSKT